MARERAFTDKQVTEAGSALLMEGKNINGTSLRNKIGAGRPSSLMEVYQSLKESGQILAPSVTTNVEPAISRQELPPEVADMLSVILGDVEKLVRKINDRAHFTVEQRLNSKMREANERVASAAKREAESLQEQDKAFEKLEDALDEKSSLQSKITDLEKENAKAQGMLDTQAQQLATQSKTYAELQSMLDQEKSDHIRVQVRVETVSEELARQRKKLTEAQAQLNKSLASTARLEGKLEAVKN